MKGFDIMLLATSPSKKGIIKLINEFYFSENYYLDKDLKLKNDNLSEEKLKKINDTVKVEARLNGYYFMTK